jgi:dihydrofolate reductase
MKISVNEFMTLDGVVQGPGGPDEDTSGGFAQGGWLMPYATDEAFGEIVEGWFEQCDELLLGRSTYQMMHTFWSQIESDDIAAVKLNHGRKHLLSTTLRPEDATWEGTHLIRDLDAVRHLKSSPGGELQVHGSAQLARTLHEARLVDVYRFLIAPVVVGSGKRLFGTDGPPSGFRVLEQRVLPSGLTALSLAPEPLAVATATVQDGRDVVVGA